MPAKNRGQALLMTIIILPLFMLLAGISLRSGKTLVIHQHLVSHCNYVVLEALRIEANALRSLGALNPYAREVIKARRTLDTLIEASFIIPIIEPELLEARKVLKSTQASIEARQKMITQGAQLETLAFARTEAVNKTSGQVSWSFRPTSSAVGGSSWPHLYVQKAAGYESEVGAPLEPSLLFDGFQAYEGTALVQTESFLPQWQGLQPSAPLHLACRAKINMRNLEGPWTVILTNAVNPWSKSL